MINFVSNLPADLRSGGFSAMNHAALGAARQVGEVHYAGPIDPPASFAAKLASKLARTLGGRSDYFFFSDERLNRIASEVATKVRSEASLDFFHGFTPWVRTSPPRPFAAWSDCIFPDYMEIFHPPAFRSADLDRIARAEAAWLAQAQRVGFSSLWAAQRATEVYGLDPARVDVLGVCGEFTAPDADVYDGRQQFAFISTNFEAKGGPAILKAFAELRRTHPAASLVVVGDPPKTAVGEGVEVTGYLKKEDREQQARLRDVFARSRAIVNLSRSDTAPVLLIEAAYFGCPVISSRRYGIPEIVIDGETGFLIDGLEDIDAVADAMRMMLADEAGYRRMRARAWGHSRSNLSREAFDTRTRTFIVRAMGGGEAQ